MGLGVFFVQQNMVETMLPDGLETSGLWRIANFGIFIDISEFFAFLLIFSVFQKNRVFGYSWSTILWHRCYYPHRSRHALSPVCGIFFYAGCNSECKEKASKKKEEIVKRKDERKKKKKEKDKRRKGRLMKTPEGDFHDFSSLDNLLHFNSLCRSLSPSYRGLHEECFLFADLCDLCTATTC